MKASYRPLSAYRIISLTSCGVHFVAFLLFLLVGLSLTIIKPIFLLSIRSTAIEQQLTSIATELKFGVWGVCASGYYRIDHFSYFIAYFLYHCASQLNPDSETCFGPMLGYKVSSFVNLSDAGISTDIVTVIENVLLVVLVLHPVSAAWHSSP
jgi:hypothetical protein